MARTQDAFTLVGKHMRKGPHDPMNRPGFADLPIADLIRRIDRALLERRAA